MQRKNISRRVVGRGLRAVVAMTTFGIVELPVAALASSVNSKIPNGYYATVVVANVPSGEDVEFTLHQDSFLTSLTLTCQPNATDAKLIADVAEVNILNWAIPKHVTLSNGSFFYSGLANVT